MSISPTPITSGYDADAVSPTPRCVDAAFQLWIAALAISGLSGLAIALVGLVVPPAVTEQIVGELVTERLAVSDVAVGLVTLGVAEAVVAGACVLVALRMRAGHRWARTLLTALSVLGLAVLAPTTVVHPALAFVAVVHVLLLLAAVVCAYQPAAAPWFRSR